MPICCRNNVRSPIIGVCASLRREDKLVARKAPRRLIFGQLLLWIRAICLSSQSWHRPKFSPSRYVYTGTMSRHNGITWPPQPPAF